MIWAEKYEIITILNDKKDTKVMLAKHKKLESLRLIKQIKKSSKYYKQLSAEAFLMKELNHPCIPQIFDIEEDEASFIIIEQYIEGKSLKSYSYSTKFNENIILEFMIQICEIIYYLHSHKPPVYYLDLKPENIIIAQDKLWIVDFGSAVYSGQKNKIGFGTPGYAAPEQYGGGGADEQSDIYSIGVLFYYMLTGTLYSKETYRNIDFEHCRKEFKRIINRCIKKQKFLRYPDVSALEKQLKNCRKKKKNIEWKSITIAVAGAQQRIGTTHIALLLCTYLNKHYGKTLYLEKNGSGMLLRTIDFYKKDWSGTKIPFLYEVNSLCMAKSFAELPFGNIEEEAKQEFSYIIEDYGILKEAKPYEFFCADICFVVVGTREWEQIDTTAAIAYCQDFIVKERIQKRINYLFNLTDPSHFYTLIKQIKLKQSCFRFSYVPNLFEGEEELIEPIITELLSEITEKREKAEKQ